MLLEETFVAERDVPAVADHDVVEELDAKELARLLEASVMSRSSAMARGRPTGGCG